MSFDESKIEEALQNISEELSKRPAEICKMLNENFSDLSHLLFEHRLPPSLKRVESNTAKDVNLRIKACTESRVAALQSKGGDAIESRLKELEYEWDIERVLETHAASLSLIGFVLSVTSRKFLMLPFIASAFLLQHALQGFCPPVPIIRRIGVRTCSEIEQERFILKLMRNDFNNLPDQNKNILEQVKQLFAAAEK